MKAAFFVEPPRVAVLFQHPQRHFRESAPPKLGTHVIDQGATVALTSQMGQDMYRRDLADARGVIIRVTGWNHLAKGDRFAVFLDQKHGPRLVGDALRPKRR